MRIEYHNSQSSHGPLDDLDIKLLCLQSILDRLELFPETTPARENGTIAPALSDRKIFLVHGHDEGKRESVACFLGQLDLTPIILHERPSEGRTLIEKIEHNSNVGFAVVLLTSDDVGSAKGATTLKPRSRQNVVFELGYFWGLLGRKKVCALYESGVELPTDIEGWVYVPFDDHGGWKLRLARELKATGYEIDPDRLI